MNNREIASLIWLGVVLIWALIVVAEFRVSLGAVIRTFFGPRLFLPLLGMFAHLTGLVFAASCAGLWGWELLSDTVVWVIACGFGLFGAGVKMFEHGGSLRSVLRAALGVTVFMEVFVNLYVFPLAFELVLAPLLAILAMAAVVAEGDEQLALVKRFVDRLLTWIGLGAILIVAEHIWANWSLLDQTQLLQRFALPVWLTIGAMPFVAVLGVYSAYDSAFSQIRSATDDWRRRWRARLVLLTGLHLRARAVSEFNGRWCKELTAAGSLAQAKAVVSRFRAATSRAAQGR